MGEVGWDLLVDVLRESEGRVSELYCSLFSRAWHPHQLFFLFLSKQIQKPKRGIFYLIFKMKTGSSTDAVNY